MAAIKRVITSLADRKISIALIGMAGTGKKTLRDKIFQTDERIQVNVGGTAGLEIQTVANLSIITWDLEDKIPENGLWKRAILGADALFYVVDATDKMQLVQNQLLIYELIRNNCPIRFLILAAKADSQTSLSLEDIHSSLQLSKLDAEKCSYHLLKFSSQTGEGMYSIAEWVEKTLFKKKERIINYVTVQGFHLANEKTGASAENLMVETPNVPLLSAFREMKRKVHFFSKAMRIYGAAEEVLDIGKFKIVFVKEQSLIVALLIANSDSVARAFEIAKGILKFTAQNWQAKTDLKKLIKDLYPLDVPGHK